MLRGNVLIPLWIRFWMAKLQAAFILLRRGEFSLAWITLGVSYKKFKPEYDARLLAAKQGKKPANPPTSLNEKVNDLIDKKNNRVKSKGKTLIEKLND